MTMVVLLGQFQDNSSTMDQFFHLREVSEGQVRYGGRSKKNEKKLDIVR